jgi:LemA protein
MRAGELVSTAFATSAGRQHTLRHNNKVSTMSTEVLVGVVLALMLVGVLAYAVSTYNEVQRLLQIIPEVASNIAVLQKKRTDLIAKLISIVDSYDLHESGISNRVSGDLAGNASVVQGQGAGQTRGVVERLASLRMAFPELKADSLYEKLMQELSQVESDIADRRERYNATVRTYNTSISQFPSNLLLSPFSYQPRPFLSDQELSA